jgi:hypothetical protein
MSGEKKYIYTVKGQGQLPFDMLRYDQAWPRTSRDAALIDAHVRSGARPRVEWEVDLMGIKMPTEARWRSYGWEVQQSPGEHARSR